MLLFDVYLITPRYIDSSTTGVDHTVVLSSVHHKGWRVVLSS